MDEGLDTGDIAAQTAVPLPDGIAGTDAERLLMLAGLDLLRGVLRDLAAGIVQRRPQPPGGSYFGFPGVEDFTLSTKWPARRAFNFMRGTAERGLPYAVEIAGKTEWLVVADDYKANVELHRPSVRHGRNIIIRFTPGVLYARLAR
jgi:methionyl-tRNA formyltransferase